MASKIAGAEDLYWCAKSLEAIAQHSLLVTEVHSRMNFARRRPKAEDDERGDEGGDRYVPIQWLMLYGSSLGSS